MCSLHDDTLNAQPADVPDKYQVARIADVEAAHQRCVSFGILYGRPDDEREADFAAALTQLITDLTPSRLTGTMASRPPAIPPVQTHSVEDARAPGRMAGHPRKRDAE